MRLLMLLVVLEIYTSECTMSLMMVKMSYEGIQNGVRLVVHLVH